MRNFLKLQKSPSDLCFQTSNGLRRQRNPPPDPRVPHWEFLATPLPISLDLNAVNDA